MIFRMPFNIFAHYLTTRNDFDSANPSSVQDACHIWTQLNDFAHDEFSWLSG